jgi:5-methylcytosine-specific restriction endonuclease McrA
MKSKRSKACSISKVSVKQAVYERHFGRCLFCGKQGTDFAHYISRANGGLGIEQNLVLLCRKCHFDLDQTPKRKDLLQIVKRYLVVKYQLFKDEDRVYKKYKEIKDE